MSHKPNWEEYGKPVAEGSETAVEVHDRIYGTFKDDPLQPASSGGQLKHTPSPFTVGSQPQKEK